MREDLVTLLLCIPYLRSDQSSVQKPLAALRLCLCSLLPTKQRMAAIAR